LSRSLWVWQLRCKTFPTINMNFRSSIFRCKNRMVAFDEQKITSLAFSRRKSSRVLMLRTSLQWSLFLLREPSILPTGLSDSFSFCMREAFNFHIIDQIVFSHVVFMQGKYIQTYLAWLERLIIFCYWMAYHVVRWPIDLVSLRES